MPPVIVFGVVCSPFVMAAVTLMWAWAALLLDAWHHRPSMDLAERLRPYQPSVADEAKQWLDSRA